MEENKQTAEAALPDTPFLRTLVSLIRAEDTYGVWERRTDADLLSAFIVTKEARRANNLVCAEPNPAVLHRVEQFYRTVGLLIETRTGLMASPMVTMNHEGGRVILIVGKLVAYATRLRDVQRFGFPSFDALAAKGEEAVAKSVQVIESFTDVARA